MPAPLMRALCRSSLSRPASLVAYLAGKDEGVAPAGMCVVRRRKAAQGGEDLLHAVADRIGHRMSPALWVEKQYLGHAWSRRAVAAGFVGGHVRRCSGEHEQK